jgi:hypothetical protein
MSAVLDTEKLRAELAAKHQVVLSANDPIFITLTLNDLVLTHHVKRIEELNAASRAEVAADLTRQLEAAKTSAADIVTRSAQYIADQVRSKVDEELLRAASSVTGLAASARAGARMAQWAAALALLCAGICLGLAVAAWH